MHFADADCEFNKADFVIFGIPYDKTSSFRKGAEKGPRSIRKASWNFETFDLRTGVDLRNISINDYGDIQVKGLSSKQMVEKVKEFSTFLLKNSKFPIAIGGEHSITTGIIRAFPKDTSVLYLDAHLDFRNRYQDNLYNHACVLRRIENHTKNVAIVGIRSAEKEEFDYAKERNLFFIDAFSVREKGIPEVIHKIEGKLKGKIYLTIDMDVIDPAYAPGTSTPEPFGLTPLEVLEIIEPFSPKLVGFDVVEVCPPYDNGESSLVAAKLIRSIIGMCGE
jgi:agmatinase